ncbi:hypothetical protein GCM10017786_13170 [Amycolatopsis deserti]|uniref:Uncharacterized protein n=1 Tax=Amycolatopsis deserti TaxID=185696 RepID=A0ABQ3IHB9_9PSEU|nr:hypothetical protein [Amycolatopsis deserti]GHE83426.1 hypothetical protein GCM10017786_13170 [Amycolatopsis deserti]
MTTLLPSASSSPHAERRLNVFGLSTELVHSAFRPGLSRATNRTSKALGSTPGTDLYHDTMESLHLQLAESGWRLVYVDHQPRLLHPEGLLSFTVASATNVADPDRRRQPRTRRKGKATRDSLTADRTGTSSLFEGLETNQDQELLAAAEATPLWLLLHERTDRGLRLELSRPSDMTEGGIVTKWEDRILIAFLDLDGDLSIFDNPNDSGDIDVRVEPR